VAQANFLFAGLRSLRSHLDRLLGGATETSLLDVGVGSGEVSGVLARVLAARARVRWVGLDLHPVVLGIARERVGGTDELRGLVCGDATSLPFADGSFDFAISTLTLHHLADHDCVRMLSEMARVSRRAVVVSDLERRLVNYLGARLLSRTLWRGDPVTRHDAGLSVRRAFTATELLDLGRQVPFRSLVVRRHFPFRLVLEGRP
jgi:SAM-dependent methyltransferase